MLYDTNHNGETNYAYRRFRAVMEERLTYESHWRELSDYILPRRSRFLTTDRNKGTKKNTKIIDSTAGQALRILASGMQAGITSPARPWFRLATTDTGLNEMDTVKTWLFETESAMRRVFAQSNIYNSLQVCYEELGCFGTMLLAVEEDFDNVIHTYPFTAGEYGLITDHKNRIVGYCREFSMTVDQIVREYGREKVTSRVLDLYDKGSLDIWIDVCHLVEPNEERNVKSPFAKNKAFRSWTWEKNCEKDMFLRQSGYDELPAIGARWHVTGTDIYGRSPGMEGLGDIKQLQMEQRRKGQGIDKLVDPPMVAHPALRGQPASVLPGGVTYVDAAALGTGNVGFKPAYQVDIRLGELREDINEVQTRIYEVFYADLFRMISNMQGIQPRNELEILERKEEKLIQLGPVLERLHFEALDPLIDRTFAIMERVGLIPEAPQEAEGAPLKVEYISLLAQAQKAVGTQSITAAASFVGNLAQFNPDVLDKLDFDQAVDEYADMTGAPPKIIRSDEAVQQLRDQKAQQMQQQQALQTAQAGAQTAKTLSETKTEDKNLLTDISGMAQEGTLPGVPGAV